jgi:hypothetical protein
LAYILGNFFTDSSGADFSYIFSGENFGGNSAENFPPKMLGKNGIFGGKSFEKLFFQEIPQNFRPKVIFRRKKCTKNWPLITLVQTFPFSPRFVARDFLNVFVGTVVGIRKSVISFCLSVFCE